MAEVTGRTALSIQELIDSTIISGRLEGTQLILTTRGGADILAGTVTPEVSDATKAELLLAAHPVGSIYMSHLNTDPGTLFGGTWTQWAVGRVLIGVDSSDTDFNAAGLLGGEKTHALTSNEMAEHTHTLTEAGAAVYASGAVYTKTVAIGVGWNSDRNYIVSGSSISTTATAIGNGGLAAIYGHTDSHTAVAAGDGVPHNNLQPYQTCYIWRRTA